MGMKQPQAPPAATLPRAGEANGASLSPIARAKAHFINRGVARFEVPEWADEQGRPLVVVAHPLNLTDKDHLTALGRRFGADSFELMAHIVILHARDEQGRHLFTLEDKPDMLARVDPDILSEIALRIVNGPTVAEVKKNC